MSDTRPKPNRDDVCARCHHIYLEHTTDGGICTYSGCECNEFERAGDTVQSPGVPEAVAADGRVPYDLRRTAARWWQEAKIPRTRRRLYLGHGAADVSDLYESYEVTEFLRGDGARLRRLLGLSRRARQEGAA